MKNESELQKLIAMGGWINRAIRLIDKGCYQEVKEILAFRVKKIEEEIKKIRNEKD